MGYARNLISIAAAVMLFTAIGCDTTAPTAAPARQPEPQAASAPQPAPPEPAVVTEPVLVAEPIVIEPIEPELRPAPAQPVAPASPQPQAGSALRCQYNAGDVDKIRVESSRLYKNWIEMPDKGPSMVKSNLSRQQLWLTRRVESVAADGSAVMQVTLDKVLFSVDIDVDGEKKTSSYVSSPDDNSSTWPAEPTLHGATYKIVIAPDTTVTSVIGLDELRKKLRVSDDAKGVAGTLLTEDRIKRLHQRDFVRLSPAQPADATGGAHVLPKAYSQVVEIPDPMVKAMAVENSYVVGPISKTASADTIPVMLTGKALYSAPEGFPEPPTVNAFGALLIKNNSDMQNLIITGSSLFDLTARRVKTDDVSVACSLVLLEENLFGGPKPGRKSSGGKMFTDVKLHRSFQVQQ